MKSDLIFVANRGGKCEKGDRFSLGSKISVDCDCSHEIKRPLLLGRKVMINLDNVLKDRDITLPTKSPGLQGYQTSQS